VQTPAKAAITVYLVGSALLGWAGVFLVTSDNLVCVDDGRELRPHACTEPFATPTWQIVGVFLLAIAAVLLAAATAIVIRHARTRRAADTRT
jgi:hypothetical protein